MEVLFTLDGLTLEKKWNGYYIRFMGGQMDDLPFYKKYNEQPDPEVTKLLTDMLNK